MKKFKMFLTAVCTASLLLVLPAAGVSAGEYTYKVTFDAGNQGSLTGTAGLSVDNSATGSSYQVGMEEGKIVVSGLRAQDIVTFDPQGGAVSLNGDSKYYVKGVRQSGRDNNSVASSSFRVTGDADYVVAYGIRGNMVAYTVNYQDESGKTLADSRKLYGNPGDKPVVAHVYVEGYTPQALALTKTLSTNEAENVFTFVYTENESEVITRPGETVTETITETVTVPGSDSNATTTSGGNEQGRADAGNAPSQTTEGTANAETPDSGDTESPSDTTGDTSAPEADTSGGDSEPAAAAAGGETTDIQEEEVPQANSDVVDLDEEETPLGNIDINKKEVEKGLPLAAGIGIAVVAVAALGGLVWFLKKHKKA